MMRIARLMLTLSLLALPTFVYAQAPVANPGDSFGITQMGPDLATVQAYVFRIYENNVPVVPSLSSVVCSTSAVAGSFDCVALIPGLLSFASHTVTFTAANAGGESPQSAPFTFQFAPRIPTAPTGIKIIHKP